jgi:sulfoxide reductase heme-binding subunit YedZ
LVRGKGSDLKPLHEALSIATIAALLVHGLSLLGDKYMHPSLADIALPLHWSYKTGFSSLGIVAGWTLILLGPSYYVRRVIGQKRWVKLHRFTALAWIAGIVHAIGEGTDAGSAWFVLLIASTTVPALVLLLMRHLTPTAPAKA